MKTKRLSVLCLAGLCVVVSAGFAACGKHDDGKGGNDALQNLPLKPAATPIVTLAKYNAVENGMTYEQVIGIIGNPGLMQTKGGPEIGGSTWYVWQNANVMDGSMNATFQDGKLILKSQLGLK